MAPHIGRIFFYNSVQQLKRVNATQSENNSSSPPQVVEFRRALNSLLLLQLLFVVSALLYTAQQSLEIPSCFLSKLCVKPELVWTNGVKVLVVMGKQCCHCSDWIKFHVISCECTCPLPRLSVASQS